MNQPPQTFTTICKIAEIPQEEIHPKWLAVWEKIIQEFLEWLIKDNELDDSQLKKLEQVFDEILEHKTKEKNLIELVAPIFNKNEKERVIKTFARLFVKNLTEFYADLRKGLKYEQKQVLDSYLKTRQN